MLSTISKKEKITLMTGVMLVMLLSALDQTIVSTAMPRIVQELNGLEHLSWVFTAYMLTSTISIPIYGKLSDIYGRKIFFIIGIIVFLTGSALSGLSQNMLELIIFRAFQGIGGGAITSNALAIIGDIFPPAERGKWQGLFGGVFGLASVIGPILGGWITDNLSWRYNFYINIPIGILALIVILKFMPAIVPKIKEKSIDYFGAAFLSIALTTLLVALVWGGTQYPWQSAQIIGLFASSIIFFVLFAFNENRAKQAILPLDLFKNSIFTISVIISFLSSIAMFGTILYIPLFAQSVIGVSATNSGTILTPLVFSLIITSILSGQIISRTGRYKILAIVGLALITASMYLLSTMNANTTQGELLVRMVFTGLGIGVTMPIFTLILQNAFDYSRLGVVTSSSQLFRSIGGTVGSAVMGGVLNNQLQSHLGNIQNDNFVRTISKLNGTMNFNNVNINNIQGLLSKNAQNQIQSQLEKLPSPIHATIIQYFHNFIFSLKVAMADSISHLFLISSGIILVAFILSFFLKEIPLKKSHDASPL